MRLTQTAAITSVSRSRMVRQRGSALRLLSLVRRSRCELLLVRSLSFFKKKSQMVRRDFSHSIPETCAMVDGRMVDGHADGRGWRRDRAPRTERRCGMVDGRRGGSGWVGADTHIPQARTSHSQAPWRHGSNDAYGRSHVAIATAQSEGFSAGSRDGQSMVRGLARGAWLGSLRGRDRPARAASGVRASGRSNGG